MNLSYSKACLSYNLMVVSKDAGTIIIATVCNTGYITHSPQNLTPYEYLV